MSARAMPIFVAGVTLLLACTPCERGRHQPSRQQSLPPAAQPAPPPRVQAAPPLPRRFGTIGRPATLVELRAWNIDVNASGAGLPSGRGTYARGAALFKEQCAGCHGTRGEGLPPFPRLIGREPREGFPFGRNPMYAKTVGNYWPYATTLYDYINRAMPFTAPGSLHPDDVYSLVSFLLAENEIVDRGTVIDAQALQNVRMPAHDHFVIDNRTGGPVFR